METDISTEHTHEGLINSLMATGALRSTRIANAFRCVLRQHFLPATALSQVYVDQAVVTHTDPQGNASTSSSSQPSVMAAMLEQLNIESGTRVLEIGTGTGYNAALMAELAARPNNVWTLELEEKICSEARNNLRSAGYPDVNVLCCNGWQGYAPAALYDRIIVTCGSPSVAPAWFDQLEEHGILVMPWNVMGKHQIGITLRKDTDRLTLLSSMPIGFMPLRNGESRTTPLIDNNGLRWYSPSLEPEDIDLLSSLMTQKQWRQPVPIFDALLTARPTGLRDLEFFLDIEEERAVTIIQQISPTELQGQFGIADPATHSLCLFDPNTPASLIGWGGKEAAALLECCMQRWLDLGQPSPSQLHLALFPPGSQDIGKKSACGSPMDALTYCASWRR